MNALIACASRKLVDQRIASLEASRVLLRFARLLLALALCVSIEAHLTALQPVAWATMLVKNATRSSLAKAVGETFDGQHPCNLCKQINAAQHQPKQSKISVVATKPDLICATRAIRLVPSCSRAEFLSLEAVATRRPQSPPTPPPRAALV